VQFQPEVEMASLCAACGNIVAADDRFCRVCGSAVVAVPSVATANVRLTPATPAQTSGKATASLVCGLLFFIPLAFVAAIVFGHLALSEIRKSAGRLKGEGLAIAGLVLGYAWIVSIPVILIIAAIAIPNLLRARMAANESSAVAGIRQINVAEVTYSSENSNAGFTCSLSDLSRYLDGQLASGQKNGYIFRLSGCTPAETGAIVKYPVVAYPITQNSTGTRVFCSDESSVIKVEQGGSAENCLENGSPLQ
jgi:type IV pilus assembly protein PilA